MKYLQPFIWNQDDFLMVPGFGMKWYLLSNKYIADPKAYMYKLEISGPCLRFVVIFIRTIWIQTGTRVSRPKANRSGFIVRPVSCKCKKGNVWRPIRTHAGLSSTWSDVNIPIEYSDTLDVSYMYLKKPNLKSAHLLPITSELWIDQSYTTQKLRRDNILWSENE